MKRAQRVLTHAFQQIFEHRIEYVRTFLVVRGIQVLLFLPLTSLLFYCMYTWTGFDAITEYNIGKFLAHPYAIFLVSVWLLCCILFIYYELGFYFLQAYYQQKGMPYTFNKIWRRLHRKAVYFFSAQSLVIIAYVILLIPLAAFLLPVTLTQQLQLPAFIVDELMHSTRGKWLYGIAITVLGFMTLRLLFTLPIFIIHPHLSIWESVVQSWQFSRKKLFETIVLLATLLVTYSSMLALIIAVAFLPLWAVERFLPVAALPVAGITLTLLEVFLVTMFTVLQALFSHIIVSVLYNHSHAVFHPPTPQRLRQTYRKYIRIGAPIVILALIVTNIVSLERSIYAPDTLIIAHRGFMSEGVENTISALVASVEAGADIVEIDIQQTKDGEFVVFHDATLNRLANRSEAVHTLTLAQLMAIEVTADGHRDMIPSLQQMIDAAKAHDVTLLVEVKTHGYETPDYLERIVAQLADNGVLSTYYVQSLNNTIMEKMEALEPRLKTGSVYAFHVGSLPTTDTDFYAIEDSSVSAKVLEEARQKNKPLFIWTVNSERSLQRYLEQDVDGLITNNPHTAAKLRSRLEQDEYFLTRVFHRLTIIF